MALDILLAVCSLYGLVVLRFTKGVNGLRGVIILCRVGLLVKYRVNLAVWLLKLIVMPVSR